MRILHIFLAAGLGGSAVSASAEVTLKTDDGFVSRVTAEVAASPADAWKAMTTPSLWWNAQHTFSGDAANLTLDPTANGCFCEKLPVPKDAPAGQKSGSVMHMRVVYAEPYRALRMVGGLGPLQSEAINGTMTVTFKPVDGSDGKTTRILWEYVVGGFMRYKTEMISGAVDKVLAEQIAGLSKLIGPAKNSEQVPADFRLPIAPATSPTTTEETIVPVPPPVDNAPATRIIDDGRAPVGSEPRGRVVTGAGEEVPNTAVESPAEPAADEKGGTASADQLGADELDQTVRDDTSIVELPLEPSTAAGADSSVLPSARSNEADLSAGESPPSKDKVDPDAEVTLRKLFGKKKRSVPSQ